MKSLILYLLILMICIGSAYLMYNYIPPDTSSPYLSFARNVAEYIVSSCETVKEYLKEPIQWVLFISGILLTMHGIRHGSGLLVALGLNIAILGLGWQVAKEIYNLAYNVFHNPLVAGLCVILGAIVGSSIIKSWLKK